jgi:hypothetical protein
LLLPLIGLDPFGDLVAVVDLVAADRPAVDAALRIDELIIVLLGRAQNRADNLGRAGAVALVADDDFLVRSRRGAGKADAENERQQGVR